MWHRGELSLSENTTLSHQRIQVNHVEYATCRRSVKDEDISSRCEQEQESEDHWMVGSGLILCL